MRHQATARHVRRRGPLPILLAGLLLLACGDDDAAPTEGDPGGETPAGTSFDVPADGTLGQVVALASAGDTIRVSGTTVVAATVTIDASLDGLVVIGRMPGRGDARAVLDAAVGTGTVLLVDGGANDVTIGGLEIRGTFGTGVRLGGLRSTVTDMWISGATQYAVACVGSADGSITRSVLEDAGLFGVQCNAGTSPTIRENTIVGSGDCGIISSQSTPVIERNVIYGSVNWGVACFGTSQGALSCNVTFMNGLGATSGCSPGAGDVDADPLFCADGSYALSEGSPAADTGACGWIGAVQVVCAAPRESEGSFAHADR